MNGSFEIIGSNIKITFDVTAPADLVVSVVGDAAEYLWEHGRSVDDVLFDDLNNQQKLQLVADHVQRVIIDLANTFKSEKAQADARAAEKANEYQF